jgi:DNA-binding response OmpR family regulator
MPGVEMNQILLMSNDPIFKRKSLEVLASAGFKVTEVSDAFDGLLLVDRDGFSAIIIDEELADIDGYRAFEKTRQYSQVPLILLGTESPEDVWAKIDKQRFDVYLKKPVTLGELVEQTKFAIKSAFSAESTMPVQVAESTPETHVKPNMVDQMADRLAVKPQISVEETLAPAISEEVNQGVAVPVETDSIEIMIAGLERQVSKIKRAIIRINQLRNTINETKNIVRQQQQDLQSVENKLQEINDQLKDILGDSAVS